MKILVSTLCILLSFSSFADEASDLFAKRGLSRDGKAALEAADLVKTLAAASTSKEEKAGYKSREAEYIYFYGTRLTSKDAKKKFHIRGYEAALASIKLLAKDSEGKVPTAPSNKVPLAKAHYFYAINLGKWAEANGVLSSLSRWPELKGHLNIIDSLDKSVEEYGSARVRARALQKLPFGSNSDARKLLKEAFNKTLSDMIELSRNATTVSYYLDILAATGDDDDTFCEVYEMFLELSDFSDEELLEYNGQKLPETKKEIENFLKGKGFEEDVKKYFDRNC
ncbi:MAG: hypothetical protein HOJ35_13250 [Bdellovibrionales bacterium]|nr:hypothetical protein [Bdellovibrionales bacterium]